MDAPLELQKHISTSVPVDGGTKVLLAKWTTTVDSSRQRLTVAASVFTEKH